MTAANGNSNAVGAAPTYFAGRRASWAGRGREDAKRQANKVPPT